MVNFKIQKKSELMYKYARRYILCDIPKVHANYRLSLDDYRNK